MSRQARQRSITDIYHVIQRGIDRMVIFRDDDDRQMFLNLLRLQLPEILHALQPSMQKQHLLSALLSVYF